MEKLEPNSQFLINIPPSSDLNDIKIYFIHFLVRKQDNVEETLSLNLVHNSVEIAFSRLILVELCRKVEQFYLIWAIYVRFA